MATLLWELLPSFSINKKLDIIKGARDADGTVPDDEVYDLESPEETWTLKAKHLTWSEMQAERAKVIAAAQEYTYTLYDGNTVTGIPDTFSANGLVGNGTYEVTVGLKIPWKN
jgi:hypothetical protein